jgi:hypothetical protein
MANNFFNLGLVVHKKLDGREKRAQRMQIRHGLYCPISTQRFNCIIGIAVEPQKLSLSIVKVLLILRWHCHNHIKPKVLEYETKI